MHHSLASLTCCFSANVFIKLKKPNAAIRDAETALKVNLFLTCTENMALKKFMCDMVCVYSKVYYSYQINPDSAKGYKIRGFSRAMMGLWKEALIDLHMASKLDYDEAIDMALKKVICILSADEACKRNHDQFFCSYIFFLTRQVEPNVHKIEEHKRKFENIRKQKELKRAQPKKQPPVEAQVSTVHSYRVKTLQNCLSVRLIESYSCPVLIDILRYSVSFNFF